MLQGMHEEETTLSSWTQLPHGGGYYQWYVQEVVLESLTASVSRLEEDSCSKEAKMHLFPV
jgi:hypothetical protein